MYRRRSDSRKRRFKLGVYPAMALSDAKEEAAAKLREVARGEDPAAIKQAERRTETFAELADEYLERYAKTRKRSWKQDEQVINRDLLPSLGLRKANDVKRADVRRLLDAIVARGSPIQANRTLEILRKIYNWAISQEIGNVEVNPCHMIEKPAKEHRRERVLTDSEIRLVWEAIEQESPMLAAMLKLRLLTAQRGGEIAHMRKKDLDGDWWTIPGEFAKNGISHRVPLSPQAVVVLNGVIDTESDSPWVFTSASGKRPLTVVWKSTQRIRVRSGVEFVAHDFRRTAASKMTGDLGISRFTVGRILNHVERGVTAVYDRHSYDPEKRQALEAWGRRLEKIISGEEPADETVMLLRSG